jgi:hypothetical protein
MVKNNESIVEITNRNSIPKNQKTIFLKSFIT